jgi:putative intracellular protease/amidase
MSAEINVIDPAKPKKVLMVIANPATSTTLGIPVGFWGAELAHAWMAFEEVGYETTIASPAGGRCEMDAWSDPRDESRYSFGDLITMGFINTPEYWALVENTKAIDEVDHDSFDALVIVGGQSPMFTFRESKKLQGALRTFYEAGKVTCALCHGVAALIDCKLSDGSYLIEGRTMTGFANVEEEFGDEYVGKKMMPWHIEDAARERGANYIQGGRFKAFAVRDGRLITGQQQYSGGEVAKKVIEALGV